ncbi:MAG: AAA family ATPase, partial [Anaerolineae bacterium]|nr:AAA family ATPase [Anaerolineae bacterium]
QHGLDLQELKYVSRILDLDPTQEQAHRQKMIFLARNEQRSAALAQYETCRQILADTLGVEPEPETQILYQDICRGQVRKVGRQANDSRSDSGSTHLLAQVSTTRTAPTSFVARRAELAQLDQFLHDALAAQGRVMFVTGEAGSGKTALVQEFAQQAQTQVNTLLVAGGRCNAYDGIGDPYLPFREIIHLLIGEVDSEQPAKTVDLEQTRRLHGHGLGLDVIQILKAVDSDFLDVFVGETIFAEHTPSVLSKDAVEVLQLEGSAAQRTIGTEPPQIKQVNLFEQFTQLMQTIACQQPLILILDDLQWADHGTLGLLFHLGRRIERSRILVIGIYRPTDVIVGRSGQRHPLEPIVNEFQRIFGTLHVDLDTTQEQSFTNALLDRDQHRLSEQFRRTLHWRTSGHALFTIEMLREMKARGDLVQDEEGYWIEGDSINWDNLPARVEGIIRERLLRLPKNLQETLRIACVEGEQFVAEVVAHVQSIKKRYVIEQLSRGLDKQHGLVQYKGSQQSNLQTLSLYRFRHILFQDYLYRSLDPAERRYLHQSVAEALEQLYNQHTEDMAVQLARHFRAAGINTKAIEYLRQAGERAVKLSANEEAIGHFSQALSLIESLPDGRALNKKKLTLLIALGRPLMASKGYAAPEVENIFARARVLCEELGETPQRFPIFFGLFAFYFVRGKHQTAVEVTQQFLQKAKSMADVISLQAAHRSLGTSLVYVGEFQLARKHLEHAVALYDHTHHRELIALYNQDHGVCGLAMIALPLWLLGYPDQALVQSRRSVFLAKKLSHPFSLAFALCIAAKFHQFRQEVQPVRQLAEQAIALTSRLGFPVWLGWSMILQGWALMKQGQIQQSIDQIEKGIAISQASGAEQTHPYFLTLLAETYGQAGRLGKGLATIDEALLLVEKNNERLWEAEIYRLKGELLYRVHKNSVEVEENFNQAIQVARRQNAKTLEQRAALSLKRFKQSV